MARSWGVGRRNKVLWEHFLTPSHSLSSSRPLSLPHILSPPIHPTVSTCDSTGQMAGGWGCIAGRWLNDSLDPSQDQNWP